MAWAAARAGSLSRRGALAATLVGAMAAAAGWAWAALLVAWFVASSALTRVGAVQKSARTRATRPAESARGATQVWANGGVFALAAAAGTWSAEPALHVAALGALSAAAADTWATEVGVWLGGTPRSIVTGRVVEPGLSGGVTWAGTAGGALGALAMAVAAGQLLSASALGPVFAAGVMGGAADSVLGATVQHTRRCPRCARWTERAVHDCGTPTEPARGWRWMTNDTVNLLATAVGAGAAFLLMP